MSAVVITPSEINIVKKILKPSTAKALARLDRGPSSCTSPHNPKAIKKTVEPASTEHKVLKAVENFLLEIEVIRSSDSATPNKTI
jgi:hypothetical protein